MGRFFSRLLGRQALTSFSITPWVENLGYQNCFISAAFVGMACASVFLFMIKFGKTFRERSREKYWNLVQENWEKGMGS
jgi:hypothetical protein